MPPIITATYAINKIGNNDIDVDGSTLQEAIDNMVAFWNAADETTEAFEVTTINVTTINGDEERTEVTIEGVQRASDAEIAMTSEEAEYTITITITAEQN